MPISITYKLEYYRPAIQPGGIYHVSVDTYWIDCPQLDPFYSVLKSLDKVPGVPFPYATCTTVPPGPGPFKNKFVTHRVYMQRQLPPDTFWVEESAANGDSIETLLATWAARLEPERDYPKFKYLDRSRVV